MREQAARFQQSPGFYRQLFWYAGALSAAGAHERLQPLLDELAQAYRRLGSSDTAHLHTLGLPFLSSFLDLVVRHEVGHGQHDAAADWLQDLGQALSEVPSASKDGGSGGLILGEGWSIKPYGYIKLDMVYDDSGVGGGSGEFCSWALLMALRSSI